MAWRTRPPLVTSYSHSSRSLPLCRCAGGSPGRRGAGAGGRARLPNADLSAVTPGSAWYSPARAGTPPSPRPRRWWRTGHPTGPRAAGRLLGHRAWGSREGLDRAWHSGRTKRMRSNRWAVVTLPYISGSTVAWRFERGRYACRHRGRGSWRADAPCHLGKQEARLGYARGRVVSTKSCPMPIRSRSSRDIILFVGWLFRDRVTY
jgi:hypothetical protein